MTFDYGQGPTTNGSFNFGDPTGSLKSALGLTPSGPNVPWEKIVDTSKFFPSYEIVEGRWNGLFPYRLLVIDVTKNNTIVNGPSVGLASQNYIRVGTDYVLCQTGSRPYWEMTLPITPQQLAITDTYAINNTPTMRGIVEEHNGVKYKTITASGTTGIWPLRTSRGADLHSTSIAESIVGGTISSAKNAFNAIKNIGNAFSGKSQNPPYTADTPEPGETGYFQALKMGQFIERYSEEKKKPENKGWRLVFDIPKQNQSFVVTPMVFELSQNQQKPMEYLFKLQFKAWKRVDLDNDFVAVVSTIPYLSPNFFQKAISTVKATRSALAAASNVLESVKGDIGNVLNLIRQTSLVLKDAAGLVKSVADLPKQLQTEIKSSLEQSLAIARGAFQRSSTSVSSQSIGGALSQGFKSAINPTHSYSDTKSASVINHLVNRNAIYEGLGSDAVLAGALGKDAANAAKASDLNDIYDNPDKYFDLFDTITTDELKLTPPQQKSIEDEVAKVQTLTVKDFVNFRSQVQDLMLNLSNNFGTGNTTYAKIYGRPAPTTRNIPISLDENDLMISLMNLIQVYDQLTATKEWDDGKAQNTLDYVGTLASNSGINFEQYTSKYPVPVPFGLTIEEISARYLGDPDKWIELVTVNNLRSPYIDEDGFVEYFLSNGYGRQFTVTVTDNELYIGQQILLSSNSVSVFSRNIINIESIDETTNLITVDGLDDLDSLTIADGAKFQGYLPATVNSQNQIYIPSYRAAEDDDRTYEVPNLPIDKFNKVAKVDWLLTTNGDIAINSVGDFRLSTGLNNLVQAMQLKIKTRKGTLLRHLDYGLGLKHGTSIADIESGNLIKELNNMVKDDARFSGIHQLNIIFKNGALQINMSVTVANGTGIIPITFDV